MKVLINFGYQNMIAELSGVELQALEAVMNKFQQVDSRFNDQRGNYDYLCKVRQEKFKAEIVAADVEIIPFAVHSKPDGDE